jgi:hypothetical protein
VLRLSFYIILFIFNLSATYTQNLKNNINFSLLNYELTNTKIDLENQELFLSAILSLGDNKIVVEEIIRTILMRPDLSKVDSTFNYLMSNFTIEDSIAIHTFLQTGEDWRDEAYYVVMMSYLGQAYLDGITLSEAYLNIQKNKPAHFPNKPDESFIYNNPFLGIIEKKLSYIKWAVKYPDEYNFFVQLLRQQTKRKYFNDDDLLVNKFLKQVEQNAIENKKVDQESIPITIIKVIEIYSNQKKKSLKFEDLCQPETIDKFIANAYELVYQKPISNVIANSFNDYVKQNGIYDASLIYLAIILSKYE